MTRLVWDSQPHNYEFGVDKGVFYPKNSPGVVWDGLISVTEDPSDSEEESWYVDGVRRRHRRGLGYFAGSIKSVSYPEAFYDNVLIARRPRSFGFSYRVKIGDHYKIHIVYNSLVATSSYVHQQTNKERFSWRFTSLPVAVPSVKRTAHLIVDTSVAWIEQVSAIEDILYGTSDTAPRLPLPAEIIDIFEANAVLRVIDNGDGTWTAISSRDHIIEFPTADDFTITWPSAIFIDADTYTLSSL